MIGIVGASGLIGRNLFDFLRAHGEQAMGTYCLTPKEALLRFDLLKDDFAIFDNCNVVVISSAMSNIDQYYLEHDLAYQIHVVKTIELINYLECNRIKIIFLSSDQVFDGRKGAYTEEDEPGPLNCYGSFKLSVEQHLVNNVKDYLILRLSKTYSTNVADGGMLADIVNAFRKGGPVKAAYNLIFNPTDVSLVCNGILQSIEMDIKGLYHLADKTIMSRYDFACAIAKEYDFDHALIQPIDFNELGCLEKRSLNSSLNVEKINELLKAGKY
jgi:dTDP-4-dehydrorhamnose reductase